MTRLDESYSTEALNCPALPYEDGIVWLEDVSKHPYVREMLAGYENFRRRKPKWYSAGRMVGYSVLRPDAPNNGMPGYFERRLFWLRDTDPYDGRGAPCEGVDPLTIEPGKKSRVTYRSWETPSAEERLALQRTRGAK